MKRSTSSSPSRSSSFTATARSLLGIGREMHSRPIPLLHWPMRANVDTMLMNLCNGDLA